MAVAVLAMASVLSTAVPGPAPAAGPSSTVLLSRPTGLGALPVPGDEFSFALQNAMSGDGRVIVFRSSADDLGVRDTLAHAWVRDTLTGVTTLVDRVPGGGAPGNGLLSSLAISRDGGTVCFSADSTNLVPGVSGLHVFVVTRSTGAIVVADRANGPGGALGNGTAGSCALSASGTRVVFESDADNLVSNDTNSATDVFVRDLVFNTTTRVSVGPGAQGAQAPDGGRGAAISGDGAKFAFETRSKLVGGDTNTFLDVYVRNLQAGTTVRASVGTGGVAPSGPSYSAAIDDGGGRVAFVSSADNLDLGVDDNAVEDVFWRDLVSDTTVLVSRATGATGALGNAASGVPAISGDGLGVAFESLATNLAADAPPAGARWVHLRRLGSDLTFLLSRATGAAGAPADSSASSVSLGMAPTVATWVSDASNLDPAASGEFTQVFKRDLSGPTTSLVSRPSGAGPRGAAVNDSRPSGPRAISADGRLVVFESSADGLDPAAAGRITHVFVRDAAANTTTLVSRGPTGTPGVADSRQAAISAAGTHVAYLSDATNLLEGEDPSRPQVYVRDLSTGTQQVASRADGTDGAFVESLDDSIPDLSADGRWVVFATRDALVPADTNTRNDVYLRDLVAGTTTLVSVTVSGDAGDGASAQPSISDDGTRVAFGSRAKNLLGGAPISGEHVYVRDLAAGTTVLADRRSQDGAPGTGNARVPEISGAGNRVVFFASEPLTPDVIPAAGAIYVRDLGTDATLLASRADGPDGAAQSVLPGTESLPSIDHDGTHVGWTGSGAALPGGADTRQVYRRDLVANTTRLVSAVDGTAATPGNERSFAPAVSADGGCVAFGSIADDLTVPAYPTQDFAQVYLRAIDGECAALTTGTTTTSTTIPPGSGRPISARAFVLKPGKLAKLVANGVPADGLDTTRDGATLLVNGTTGSASYTLPATGWKAVSRRRPKGFKFKSAACRVALLRRKLTATCRGDTGGLRLPEPGPVGIVLIVGGEVYCTECAGRAAGRATRVFKRKACPAPPSCP